MKILTINTPIGEITYYDINSPIKLNTIRERLKELLEASINISPYCNQTSEDYLNIISYQLKKRNDDFRLFVMLNGAELIGFCAAFIVADNGVNGCLIYAAYTKPGLIHVITKDMIRFLDIFAAHNLCKQMMFHTARDEKVFGRLLKKYGFKSKRTIFEREVDYAAR